MFRSSLTVPGTPFGKPRQIQGDKFVSRSAIERYRAWCDEVRLAATRCPSVLARLESDTPTRFRA